MFSHSDRYDNSAGWQQVLISTEGGPLVVGHIQGAVGCESVQNPFRSVTHKLFPTCNQLFFCQDILVQIYGNILAKVTFV